MTDIPTKDEVIWELKQDAMRLITGIQLLSLLMEQDRIKPDLTKDNKPKRTRKLTFRPFTKKMAAQARTMHEEGTKSAVVIARKLGGVDPAKVRNLLNGA